jgi:hypothetical protein
MFYRSVVIRESRSASALFMTEHLAANPISNSQLITSFHNPMAPRLRHCVECPECCSRYLIGFSPYSNGAYLLSGASEAPQDYQLFCFCRRPRVMSRWSRNELKVYEVSNAAYVRGYGSESEIWLSPQYSSPAEEQRKGMR